MVITKIWGEGQGLSEVLAKEYMNLSMQHKEGIYNAVEQTEKFDKKTVMLNVTFKNKRKLLEAVVNFILYNT